MGSVPAAWRLLGEDKGEPRLPPTGDAAVRFVDGSGHSRPVYRYLAAHLHRAATERAERAEGEPGEPGEGMELPRATGAVEIEEALWRQCLTVWRPRGGGSVRCLEAAVRG